MIRIIGVRLGSAGKTYYFDPKDFSLRIGSHVIVETARGPRYGIVSANPKMVEDDMVTLPLRSVIRLANEEDEQEKMELRRKERDALRTCREKVREHNLEMKMVDAEFDQDGSKILFYFTADGRVDFRELVKDLASVFHVRIELRQIGVRDETRMLGGLGTCGRELCCASFLREFQPVSIKMAKEQNLSLNPAKISGACGRLMCCLKNEEETYEYLNAKMPRLNEEAVTADGQVGRVVELDVLRQRVRVLFEEEDSKELETFPVEELTFRGKKRRDNAQQEKKSKKEKGERGEKGERFEKGERGEKGERSGKNERGEKGERAGKNERGEKGERSGKNERGEKGERFGKNERGKKNEQPGEKGEGRSRRDRRGQGGKDRRPEDGANRGSEDGANRGSENGAADRIEEERGGDPEKKRSRRRRGNKGGGNRAAGDEGQKQENPKQEVPKQEAPKQEATKQDTPKGAGPDNGRQLTSEMRIYTD